VTPEEPFRVLRSGTPFRVLAAGFATLVFLSSMPIRMRISSLTMIQPAPNKGYLFLSKKERRPKNSVWQFVQSANQAIC
jgi:hypothetical protein